MLWQYTNEAYVNDKIGYEQGRFEALMHTNGKNTGGTVTYNIAEW